MSSSKTKHPRANALEVARELTSMLRPLCEPERFIFAGSLRRMKAEVGDIELVYVPLVEDRPDPEDLLGRMIPTNLVTQRSTGDLLFVPNSEEALFKYVGLPYLQPKDRV